MKYLIRFSPQALYDIEALYKHISEVLFAPIIADRYVNGIYDAIRKLTWLGSSFAINQNKSLIALYGTNVRTIHYKKVTIIYTVADGMVLIRRIMAGSLIH